MLILVKDGQGASVVDLLQQKCNGILSEAEMAQLILTTPH